MIQGVEGVEGIESKESKLNDVPIERPSDISRPIFASSSQALAIVLLWFCLSATLACRRAGLYSHKASTTSSPVRAPYSTMTRPASPGTCTPPR